MAAKKIRVGIIGANASYGWGSSAHIPALRALDEFEITALCTSRDETAKEAARHFGVPRAFADFNKLVQHPEVDLVSVCVRVPFHHQMVMAALHAGKHVFCEWPLAATTAQAEELLELATRKGLHHMVGLQARGAPAINRARDLIRDGYIGQVLACTMVVATPNWGTEFTRSRMYLADRSTGATLMTIPGGHSIDALCYCLGEFKQIAGVVATQRRSIRVVETGEMIPMTSPDQVLVSGMLQSGAVASVHIKGGTTNGTPFLLEIHGTNGDLAITPRQPGRASSVQISELVLRGTQSGQALQELAIPESYRWVPAALPPGPAFNVAQLFHRMAQEIGAGNPSWLGFDVAVQRHRLLDAIDRASETGRRQDL
jgi:predicted dehydrogenase